MEFPSTAFLRCSQFPVPGGAPSPSPGLIVTFGVIPFRPMTSSLRGSWPIATNIPGDVQRRLLAGDGVADYQPGDAVLAEDLDGFGVGDEADVSPVPVQMSWESATGGAHSQWAHRPAPKYRNDLQNKMKHRMSIRTHPDELLRADSIVLAGDRWGTGNHRGGQGDASAVPAGVGLVRRE
ncbi:hypothetical protein KAREA_18480 [Prescottella equi]|nr:hypothetical protein KAREA_18480 [Prescottella equi]